MQLALNLFYSVLQLSLLVVDHQYIYQLFPQFPTLVQDHSKHEKWLQTHGCSFREEVLLDSFWKRTQLIHSQQNWTSQ